MRMLVAATVFSATCALLHAASPSRACAQSATPSRPPSTPSTPSSSSAPSLGARAEVAAAPTHAPEASSTVTREQIQERLPRSTPDALRYEPGVSVQQTAHGQASPYVRGMTGQQVVHEFDGIRMNNGLYRQGPNQYFFTVDSYTLERVEILRGSASTLHGSDALGGAILATPRSPLLLSQERDLAAPDLAAHARLFGRLATADWEHGGRAELELRLPDATALLAGVGHRQAERLESGGALDNSGYPAPRVPRFEADGRTQLGTGFKETTFDARLVHALGSRLQLISAIYGYREFDAPRTDQCPPPEAPIDECLMVTHQDRTLGYLALRGDAGRDLRDLDLSVSVQQNDEQRINDRPRSLVQNEYANQVYTLGASARGATRAFTLAPGASYRVRYGAEAYRDDVRSSAAQTLFDPVVAAVPEGEPLSRRFERSRGQYIDGSMYLQTGLFTELELTPIDWLTLRGGGRVAAIAASAPADAASSTPALSERWAAAVGRGGVATRVAPTTTLHLNFDQGFRAPNLDDLTSRQQIGPGFQIGNAGLRPERTNTLELGVVSALPFLELDAWLFGTWIDDSIARVPREPEDCPPEADGCRASRVRLQLVNARGTALLWGAEGAATLKLMQALTLRATCSYAFGEGPSAQPGDGDATEPLSRIPPLNGTAELRYANDPRGFYVATASRWALAQRRLATSDLSDARIPVGGTPGYVVLDMRAGYRYDALLSFSAVFENVLDAAYRVHGSSIHGPGRGLLLGMVLSY